MYNRIGSDRVTKVKHALQCSQTPTTITAEHKRSDPLVLGMG